MLARCPSCDSTFVVQQPGYYRCPKCAADVSVAASALTADPYAPPSPVNDAPIFAPGEPVPWERRKEIGFWRALTQTMKLSLTEPSAFFARPDYKTLDGAHLYFFLMTCVPLLLSLVVEWIREPPIDEQLKQIHELSKTVNELFGALGAAAPTELFGQLESMMRGYIQWSSSVGGHIEAAVSIVIGSFAMLYAMAGIIHLVMKLMNRAKDGWSATLKSNIYAFSPGPLLIIPVCGSLIVACWVTSLQIIGLAKAHRVSTWSATGGVFGFHVIATCCISLPFVVVLYIVGMGMSAHFT